MPRPTLRSGFASGFICGRQIHCNFLATRPINGTTRGSFQTEVDCIMYRVFADSKSVASYRSLPQLL